jgi:fatty acid omega-hydroxylase
MAVDPEAIEYVLKTNFKNYEKGMDLNEVFEPFLGKGIFNADGAIWKSQRQIASNLFTKNTLKSMGDVFLKHGQKVR